MPDGNNPIQDFLTPEAMLTPGLAGSLTMMMTNTLTQQFEMPSAWVGLILSFVFGLLVLAATRSIVKRTVLYVLNSLVIFCVAMGANSIGTAGQKPGAPKAMMPSFVASAYAQDARAVTPSQEKDLKYCANLTEAIAEAQKNNASSDKILALVKPCQRISIDILKDLPTASPKAESRPFFQPWSFTR